MKTIEQVLREISFFDGLSDDKLGFVAGCGQNMHFEPDQFIGKENDAADFLYIIRKGNVAVQINHPVKGPLTIKTLKDDDIAGFSWIIPPYKLQFNLKAIEHTSVVALSGDCIRTKCEEDPELGYFLMKKSAATMINRLHDTRMQLLDVYSERI